MHRSQCGFTGCGKTQNTVILSEAKDLSVKYSQLLAPAKHIGNCRLIAGLAIFPQTVRPLRETFRIAKRRRRQKSYSPEFRSNNPSGGRISILRATKSIFGQISTANGISNSPRGEFTINRGVPAAPFARRLHLAHHPQPISANALAHFAPNQIRNKITSRWQHHALAIGNCTSSPS